MIRILIKAQVAVREGQSICDTRNKAEEELQRPELCCWTNTVGQYDVAQKVSNSLVCLFSAEDTICRIRDMKLDIEGEEHLTHNPR